MSELSTSQLHTLMIRGQLQNFFCSPVLFILAADLFSLATVVTVQCWDSQGIAPHTHSHNIGPNHAVTPGKRERKKEDCLTVVILKQDSAVCEWRNVG